MMFEKDAQVIDTLTVDGNAKALTHAGVRHDLRKLAASGNA